MRIYLDNCCYNRPYDSQDSFKVSLETRAKLHIQKAVKENKFELVSSYMLEYENSENRDEMKRKRIKDFQDKYSSYYVPLERRELLREKIEVVPLYLPKERPIVIRDGMMIMKDDDRLKLRPGERVEMRTVRFRTLGCYPLTGAIDSSADTVELVVKEIENASSSERANRAIDFEAASMMERRKKEGYF